MMCLFGHIQDDSPQSSLFFILKKFHTFLAFFQSKLEMFSKFRLLQKLSLVGNDVSLNSFELLMYPSSKIFLRPFLKQSDESFH